METDFGFGSGIIHDHEDESFSNGGLMKGMCMDKVIWCINDKIWFSLKLRKRIGIL